MLSFILATVLVFGALLWYTRHETFDRQDFVVQEDVYEAAQGATREITSQEEEAQFQFKSKSSEIQRLGALANFFEINRDWGVLVEVGDAYARGCYPFYGADSNTALEIYKIASRCPDRVVATRAMSRFADTRLHPISHRDSTGPPFPAEVARKLLTHAEYHIQRCPRPFSTPTGRRKRSGAVPTDTTPAPTPAPAPAPAPVQQLAVDKQNVHDHAVSRTTQQNARKIVDEVGRGAEYDRIALIDAVVSELRAGKASEQVLRDAFRVLVSLVPDKIESIGCSQLDVLNATKAKIDGVKDTHLRKNLFETLGKNLASGIERNHVVCSTGKIARIVSTLEGTGLVSNKVVPIEVVRREMGTLASKIRSDVLSEVSPAEMKAYNTSDDNNHALGLKMKNCFEQKVRSIYVEGLGLSQKVLGPIIAQYSREF